MLIGARIKNNMGIHNKKVFGVTKDIVQACNKRCNICNGWFTDFVLLTLFVTIFNVTNCICSNGETLPLPQDNKIFGLTCDPSMCRIPQGFLLNRRDLAFSIHFSDGENGWIVGDCGLALKTTDGGESWQRVTIINKIFKDVFFVGDKGWIVGEMGLIYHSQDGGESWNKQTSNVGSSLMSLYFLDAEQGIIVGADGTILRTADGGVSWEVIPFDWMSVLTEDLLERGYVSVNLYHISFLDETSGWIVGDYGTILSTQDGGREWTVSHIGYFPALFSVSFKSNTEGFVVGQNGFCLKTGNGGENWESFKVNTENSLYKIRTDNDLGIIVGDKGTMFRTDNGGKTWVEIDTPHKFPPPYPWFTDAWIFSDSPKKILSVGKSVILKTEMISEK